MSFTEEEFYEYLKTLEFYEMEDMVFFIKEYYKAYVKDPNYSTTYRYHACMAMFGHVLLEFADNILEMREKYESDSTLEREP